MVDNLFWGVCITWWSKLCIYLFEMHASPGGRRNLKPLAWDKAATKSFHGESTYTSLAANCLDRRNDRTIPSRSLSLSHRQTERERGYFAFREMNRSKKVSSSLHWIINSFMRRLLFRLSGRAYRRNTAHHTYISAW